MTPEEHARRIDAASFAAIREAEAQTRRAIGDHVISKAIKTLLERSIAEEREACARLVEALSRHRPGPLTDADYAAAIRARGGPR